MLANWIHVMIVHFAVIGTPYMAYRVISQRKTPLNNTSWKVNYSGVIVLGIIAAIAYFTGPEAADHTKVVLTSYSQDLVEDHALWGRIAFVLQIVIALIGVMGLASILQDEIPDKRITPILIGLLLINTAVLIYTGHLGGLVRRIDLL